MNKWLILSFYRPWLSRHPPDLTESQSPPPLLLLFMSSEHLQPGAPSPFCGHRTSGARLSPIRSSAAVGVSTAPANADKDEERATPDLGTLFIRFWKVAAPYWFSEDKVQARLILAAVIALTLATTGIHVGFNFLNRDYMNALAKKDQGRFARQLLYFLVALAGGVPILIVQYYARQTLSLRWRSWMTRYYMERYFKNQTYYRIQSQSIVDNPDQRIVDDLESFTGTTLYFSVTLVNAVVDMISFSSILYRIYAPLFVVLILYSLGGTAISLYLGKGLVNLNFMQEKKEADFRYALVRIRENAESIAFYGGEGSEMQLLMERFRRAFQNASKLLIASRNLDFFTSGYGHLILILPVAIVAPMYFSGKIEIGVVSQAAGAFNHILNDISLVVHEFQRISTFSAVIDRLAEVDEVLDGSESYNSLSASEEEITLLYTVVENPSTVNKFMPQDDCHKLLDIKTLTLQTPKSSRVLIKDLSLEINVNDRLLVMGPSGSGKTSLLRALAGLWSTGKGNIIFYNANSPVPENALKTGAGQENSEKRRGRSVFFLPQKPYLVLGTLRQQLLYPTWSEDSFPASDSFPLLSYALSSEDGCDYPNKPTVDELIQVLEMVCVGDILSRFSGLDSINEWSSVLSLGEQQRLAFARLLLAKPQLVLLDESTSALDDTNEARLYKQIEAAGMAYISIGHRKTLLNYHNRVLHISDIDAEVVNGMNWHLESISQINEEIERGS